MDTINPVVQHREPWNKGKLVGQKSPFKLKEIWAIRIRHELARRLRDLALFDLVIDSKLRACDLVKVAAPLDTAVRAYCRCVGAPNRS